MNFRIPSLHTTSNFYSLGKFSKTNLNRLKTSLQGMAEFRLRTKVRKQSLFLPHFGSIEETIHRSHQKGPVKLKV